MSGTTGIVRKLDELGRIVIPIGIRASLELPEKSPMLISVDGDTILIRKHEDTCLFCRSSIDLLEYKNKYICSKCLKDIKKK